jgi:hypothetical protein
MHACHFHHKERRKRVEKENGVFRNGEIDLNIFWAVLFDPEDPAFPNSDKPLPKPERDSSVPTKKKIIESTS